METVNSKYRLSDVYEGCILIGPFETMEEVNDACEEWDMDSDGECVFLLEEFNDKSQEYEVVDKWQY